MFMGNTYFYGKIVSMFGNDAFKSPNGMNKMMSYMLMSEMMKGNSGTNNSNGINSMLPFVMMNNNGFGNMFEDLFDNSENIDDNEEDA